MRHRVRFNGGPFDGEVVIKEGETLFSSSDGAALKALESFREFVRTPPAEGAGWWFCSEAEPKDKTPHYYRVVLGQAKEGRLSVVCEYGGTSQPSDS